MAIGLRAQKTLWGRAAGRCSIPECRQILFEDDDHALDPTLIGENCHIVAASDAGPRADASMLQEQRDSYPNLILCCRNHHKVIDAQETKYTVELLKQIKAQHEEWVIKQLGIDIDRQRDDETYFGYIEFWERLAKLKNWKSWTGALLSSGQPSLDTGSLNDLSEICTWLISRVWPGRYQKLEASFTNFGIVARDLRQRFLEHAVEIPGTGVALTRKFYQIDAYDDRVYLELFRQYNFHVDLVEDLTLELTRAANLICDEIRRSLLKTYRIHDGKLLVRSGPYNDLNWYEFTTEYNAEQCGLMRPYPGLYDFMTQREQRDRNFGSGLPPAESSVK